MFKTIENHKNNLPQIYFSMLQYTEGLQQQQNLLATLALVRQFNTTYYKLAVSQLNEKDEDFDAVIIFDNKLTKEKYFVVKFNGYFYQVGIRNEEIFNIRQLTEGFDY